MREAEKKEERSSCILRSVVICILEKHCEVTKGEMGTHSGHKSNFFFFRKSKMKE
jgi:hypothetical protein